jgi:biotin transporter BioY
MMKKGNGKRIFFRIAMVALACMLLGPFQYAGLSGALLVALVIGFSMEPLEGAAALALYLLSGLLLAVYPGGGSGADVLFGERGGFLLAMPFCILVISACVRGWGKQPFVGGLAGVLGAALLYFGGGILWYTVKTGIPLGTVLSAGWGGTCFLFLVYGVFAMLCAGAFRRMLK